MGHLRRAIAIALFATCLAMMAFSIGSLLAPGSATLPDRPGVFDVVVFGSIFLSFPSVGLAVAWRRPDNPVAWLFLAIGLAIAMSVFSGEYTAWAVHGSVQLPGWQIVAWLGAWGWTATTTLFLPFALVLFPDGRLPSRRWRPFAAIAVVLGITTTAALATVPGELVDLPELVNPLGAPGVFGEAAKLVAGWEFVAVIYAISLAIVALVARFRRGGTERQQVKWLLWPASVFVLALAAAITNELVRIAPEIELPWTAVILSLAALPVCAGIAILRYRLYDIDVVIRRTLVYAMAIAVLGGVYVALVLALTSALGWVVGGQGLPVALATLIIAGLFGPVRARVRAVVDRRFYRSRYDAQRTIEAFSTRLRDEVDLEAVGASLVDASGRAVQPASVGIWLRAGSG